MDAASLRRSAAVDAAPPPGLSPALQALWWDAKGDWHAAHQAAQAGEDADSAWVHALLHRREGDLANADYWYRRAGRCRPAEPLEAEWATIAAALLGG
ncbi:hypothetical protein JYK14_04815 [Siccirubricoccus sp. KC 17139]|uniref:Sel1 repeat family protein n=1 Tax=Siccirubricoccus soli TaxID=2899147 RepID=A0ABT1D2P2_9PROT|nr:hypothetical protein [Siccirubricoccus soli]MCO6415499.1 hypothetical protein [Siccirubricoccus soli]MCP2681631.1 hypothetical protein [Siccirubricoccus soli]